MKKSIVALAFAGSVVLAGCAIDNPEVVDQTTSANTPTTDEATTTTKTTVRTSPRPTDHPSGTGDSYLYDPSLDEGTDVSADTGQTVDPNAADPESGVETTDEAGAAALTAPDDSATGDSATQDGATDGTTADATDATGTDSTTTTSGTTTKTSGSTTTTTTPVSGDDG